MRLTSVTPEVAHHELDGPKAPSRPGLPERCHRIVDGQPKLTTRQFIQPNGYRRFKTTQQLKFHCPISGTAVPLMGEAH